MQCCQSHFSPTDLRCHGNEIWDKMGYNSACVRDICEIFASKWGVMGMGQRMLLVAFFPTDPSCHANEIWDKMDYNLIYVQDISEIKFAEKTIVFGRTNKG